MAESDWLMPGKTVVAEVVFSNANGCKLEMLRDRRVCGYDSCVLHTSGILRMRSGPHVICNISFEYHKRLMGLRVGTPVR